MAPAYFFCVCVDFVGLVFQFQGHQILVIIMLYNYLNVALDENKHFTYLYWWDIVWITGENTISNREHLLHHRVGNPKTLTPCLQTPTTDRVCGLPKYNKISK